jgi:hypothetical protein
LTQTAIFKNASEKWRCEQSDSFYQNFILGATGQIARGGAVYDSKSNCAHPAKRDERYEFNGNFKDARLRKSRQPLQSQKQSQRRTGKIAYATHAITPPSA